MHSSVNSNTSDTKLTCLEKNLNRVCLQQDALIPLLQIVDLLPIVHKSDSTIKMLTKKIDENEARTIKVERILEQRLKGKSEKNPLQKNEIGRIAKTCDQLQQQFKDFEQNAMNVHRWFEAKLKEEAYSVSRAIDVKLEKQKIEISKQVNQNSKNQTNNDVSEYVNKDELGSFKEQLLNEVKEMCLS